MPQLTQIAFGVDKAIVASSDPSNPDGAKTYSVIEGDRHTISFQIPTEWAFPEKVAAVTAMLPHHMHSEATIFWCESSSPELLEAVALHYGLKGSLKRPTNWDTESNVEPSVDGKEQEQ